MRIKVKDGSLVSKILLAEEFELGEPITLLFGGNGVGKTTLIQTLLGNPKYRGQFTSEVDGKNPMVFSYINGEDNARKVSHKLEGMMFRQELETVAVFARKFEADELSEGQSIIYTVQGFLEVARGEKDAALFLIDEIDSGLSVDNVAWLCNEMKKIVKKNKNVQFIVAFNNYEFCQQFSVVTSMYTGKKIIITSYDEYRKILFEQRDSLLEKRGYNQFSDVKAGKPKNKKRRGQEE